MPTDRARFDKPAFFAAIDAARATRAMTWRDVSRTTGLSASTFTRLAQGHGPDVDTMAVLADWADLDIDPFIHRTHGLEPTPPLAVFAIGFHRDPALSPTAARCLTAVMLAAYNELREAARADT